MIGEIEALFDESIDVDRTKLARAFSRMQQHVLDDGVGPLAVLHNPFEVAAQGAGELPDFGAGLFVGFDADESVFQLLDQFDGNPREIIDEIERVLDLVGDASG